MKIVDGISSSGMSSSFLSQLSSLMSVTPSSFCSPCYVSSVSNSGSINVLMFSCLSITLFPFNANYTSSNVTTWLLTSWYFLSDRKDKGNDNTGSCGKQRRGI